MKISYLLVLSVVLFVLGGCAHAPQEPVTPPRAMVIDVRTESEWKDGHLDGAVLIPHDRIEQGIAAVAPDKKTRIYLYCRTGRRTSLATDVLKKAGYEDLVNLSTLENASRILNLPIIK
ncbi:MAG: rhodanese-like domain-containing protein [Verrucomicrobia bacterium]|nr:rhodanese-like domain-containing protein [Deltaproteobacteria bacterium]